MKRLAFASALLVALAATGSANLIGLSDYYASGQTGPSGLYDIDAATGAATRYADVTGSTGGTVDPSLIGTAYLDGKIYVTDFLNDASGRPFGYVDPSTGAYTGVGTQNGSVNWYTLAANPSDHTLYTIETENAAKNSLYVVNPVDGLITDIGKTTFGGNEIEVDDLAYDSTRSVLYGWGGSSLYRIDTATAELDFVGDNGFAGLGNGWDMTYDPTSDTFYANDGGAQRLYTVDVSSGALTLVGDNASGGARINGITYAPAPVPEPASLLALGLGGAALLRRRRRA